jgi:hypothetical protein
MLATAHNVALVRRSGAGRNPVKHACAAHKMAYECFARLVGLDSGLRRNDGMVSLYLAVF